MILIADRTKKLSDLLSGCSGFELAHIHCESFSAAVDCAQKNRIRLAIVTQDLFDRHGFELLSYFQLHFPQVPVIYVSDDSRKETIISAMRRGARDFFEWPVERASLLNSIRRIEIISPKKVPISSIPPDRTSKNTNSDIESQPSVSAGPEENFDIEVYFFGNFRCVANGRGLDHWPSKKGKSIFAYLVYNDSKPVFREDLIDRFWPKIFPEPARNCLNVAIHHIRQVFQGTGIKEKVILLSNNCYVINHKLRISSDVKRFLTYWNKSRFLKVDNRVGPVVNELELAASLYHGDFMQDDRFEEWTISERENLREVYLEILENLSRIYSLDGKPKAAIELCKSIIEKDDCREKVHRRLMLCYHRIGERDHALRQFQKCKEILKRELDVGPSASTVDLYRKIRDDTLSIPRIQ